MFQNINRIEEQEYSDNKRKIDLRSLFTINDIVLYAITFMVSMVSFNGMFAPFGLAIFAASLSNGIPAGIIYLMVMLRKFNRIWIKWDRDSINNINIFYCINISDKT